MPEQTKPIAETNRFIVLDKYVRAWEAVDSYQSEADLERELIADLRNQGYEFLDTLKSTDAMLANVRCCKNPTGRGVGAAVQTTDHSALWA